MLNKLFYIFKRAENTNFTLNKEKFQILIGQTFKHRVSDYAMHVARMVG